MKKLFGFILIFIILLGIIYIFRKDIGIFFYEKFILEQIEISEYETNEYYRNNNYKYVQITDDFIAKDKKHLLNIYYTIVNSGANNFTFRCDNDYKNCLNDVDELSHAQSILSNINSFVHPFNSFSSVETKFDNFGKIEVKINKTYNEEQIREIKERINSIINTKIGSKTDPKEIIRIVHDYIIKTTKYDSNRSDKKIVKYESDIAYGPLLQGYGLCGGYTDAMALFLDYYNIPNFKVISENHVWNAVYLDNKWYHLDLTWDDPVSKDGRDILEYTFFLITTDELNDIEKEQHIFDRDVFSELA